MTIKTSKKYDRERSIFDIAEQIRNELKRYPEIINYTVSTASMASMSSNSVDVEIIGESFEKTSKLAADLKQLFKDIDGARDIQIDREEDRASGRGNR